MGRLGVMLVGSSGLSLHKYVVTDSVEEVVEKYFDRALNDCGKS